MAGRRRVKCVIVGDGAVGKTCMLISYTKGVFPEKYVPTIFDNYATQIMVGKEQIQFELWDTAGQEDFDRIRLLSYDGADVILCCYSVNSQTSLSNVRSKWYPEFRHHCPSAPFILCGTKADLRGDPQFQFKQVNASDAKKLAKELGAIKMIECSAKTGQNLKSVFDEAILAVLRPGGGGCCTIV